MPSRQRVELASAVVHLLAWVIASQAFGSHSSQVLLSMFLLHIFFSRQKFCAGKSRIMGITGVGRIIQLYICRML